MANFAWEDIKVLLKKEVPEHSYKMWLAPLELIKTNRNTVILACPNIFSKRNIISKYGELLNQAVQKIVGDKFTVELNISKNKNSECKKIKPDKNKFGNRILKKQISLPGMEAQNNLARRMRKDFTFEQFVVGSNNDFAYSAALSLASKKRNDGFNSLFLLSNTGLGKSHLSQAAGHHIIARFPEKEVYYVTAEDFTNEMISCYRNGNIGQFKDKYRKNCDVLLVDEVQYFSGKVGTQREFASTLDFLLDNGKKIIFSSSSLPTDIPKLSDKLKSRLSSGLITSLDAPDYNTRIKILKKKIKAGSYFIPERVIRYLAGEINGDIRRLESSIVSLLTKASLLGKKVDVELAEDVVKNIIGLEKDITMGTIKKLISTQYNVPISDLMSRSRKKRIVWPRQVAMYLSRKFTDHSLKSVATSFNRYHATCMHAVKIVDKAMSNNAKIRKQIEILSTKLACGDL